jgi:PelA/Pel-15E family pectate lyase
MLMSTRRLLVVVGAALFGLQACSGGGAAPQAGTGGATVTGATGGTTVTGDAGASGSGGAPGPIGTGGGGRGGGEGGIAGAGTGGTTTGAGGATAPILDQTGNPLTRIVTTYTSWLSTAAGDAAKLTADRTLADNMITWQLPHGGFYKNGVAAYAAPWNGVAARSGWFGANNVELGTIDNSATVTETMFLADVYRRSGDAKYQAAARKALDFLLTMQYPSGGFPQVYPARTGVTYSNYVTFNDDAMVRVLAMLELAEQQKTPLAGDVFTADQLAKIATAIPKAIDFILKAQIVQAGVRTVWCAQHDPITYEPRGARSYELPSKSGSESVGVIAFLLSRPQTPDIKAAAQAAIAWFKSGTVKVANTAYVSRPAGNTDDTYNPIQTSAGSTMWYRFYDLAQDVGFFSGRLPTDNPPGTGKQYDIMAIEPERRYGYQWAGAYGTGLFTYTDRVGY